ncbi:hypothetical protein BV20DRAFT_981818 [Pilatotrama ljubarskyi]|nr:hypothetical protein BV20DRAFT_981818 [Pilatotrama ljubarskyi]
MPKRVVIPKKLCDRRIAMFADGTVPSKAEWLALYEDIRSTPGCENYTWKSHSNWRTRQFPKRRPATSTTPPLPNLDDHGPANGLPPRHFVQDEAIRELIRTHTAPTTWDVIHWAELAGVPGADVFREWEAVHTGRPCPSTPPAYHNSNVLGGSSAAGGLAPTHNQAAYGVPEHVGTSSASGALACLQDHSTGQGPGYLPAGTHRGGVYQSSEAVGMYPAPRRIDEPSQMSQQPPVDAIEPPGYTSSVQPRARELRGPSSDSVTS